MESKNRKSKNEKVDISQDELLQAVIVADSFNERFAPALTEIPRCLLPIGNVPILDTLLQSLLLSKFHQVFIYANSKSDIISSHVAQWKKDNIEDDNSIFLSITVFCDKALCSVGDVVRDIDRRAIIKSDFLLLAGDLVTNVDFASLVADHKKCRSVDKGTLLTMVMTPAVELRQHDTEQLLLVTRGTDDRLLAYSHCGSSVHVKCDTMLQSDLTPARTYCDLIDPQISICSEHLPPLFSDEFDHQSIVDSVKGILINEDILGNYVYICRLEGNQAHPGCYAARVSTPSLYRAVSSHVLQQRLSSVSTRRVCRSTGRPYRCRKDDLLVSSAAQVSGVCADTSRNSVVAAGARVSSAVQLVDTAVGAHCVIDKNCRLSQCILWDGVHLGENVTATGVVMCSGVKVGAGCTLGRGVLLSPGVHVGPGVTLPEDMVVVRGQPSDCRILGDKCNGVVWTHGVWGQDVQSLQEGEGSTDEDSESGSDSADEDMRLELHDDAGLESRFSSEVTETLERALEEKLKPELVLLEINSVKHAFNISIERVHYLLCRAVFMYPLRQSSVTPSSYLEEIKCLVHLLQPVLHKYFMEPGSPVALLRALEDVSLLSSTALRVVLNLVKWCYDEDILEEDDVFAWFQEDVPTEGDAVRRAVQVFVTWLQEAEEVDSD